MSKHKETLRIKKIVCTKLYYGNKAQIVSVLKTYRRTDKVHYRTSFIVQKKSSESQYAKNNECFGDFWQREAFYCHSEF